MSKTAMTEKDLSQAELFKEVALNRSEASLQLAREEFRQNAYGTLYWPSINAENKTVAIMFVDSSVALISIKDWEWVRGW